ncbi:uncharacterized protein F5147DRAFT_772864 [Suillus discolor]|uniref:Uncharacterized protein n=1 Tax=Suillus discolor TaxID=1912936 RepID=A0A9P7JUS5_9AGAM|nr:uncharacterized protein F5147DRAFT_772864 [Suillus discolor]KAG2109556.1 hypothetical protein F5147DRAFT_772864 [Suillus discolor]
MATNSEVFDNKSLASLPPPYENVSTSTSSTVKIEQANIEQVKIELTKTELTKTERTQAVLSHLCDIISTPNFLASSVAPIIETCAAALLPEEFSDLLQNPNIEGHTAMYWAVVNCRREAFSMFTAHIPQFSSVCYSDLRLACMSTSNHALFMQLNLGHVINSKDESLRHF